MGCPIMTQNDFDYSDVQGLVRFGYAKMRAASYALLRVKDPAVARSWLGAACAAGRVTTAETMKPPPPTAMQVAFTAAGLKALGVRPSIIAGFSPEFLAGMAEENRARRLGDIESNAASNWKWGYAASAPDLMVMFFAEPAHLIDFIEGSKGNEWRQSFEELGWLGTADLDGVEPFGFSDGISQPEIDWGQQRDVISPQIDYSNVVALGEFLLGYRNEYGKYTNRPLINVDPASRGLLNAEDAPEKKDVGRNGTYLVLRQLRQDVRGFWQFAYRQANKNASEAEKIAVAFVGRTRKGSPLVPPQGQSIPGIGPDPDEICLNQFTFANDPTGVRCPFGAHVRRANPRNTDYPGRPKGLKKLITMFGFGPKGFRDDLMSAVRFHRILRRGREYGPELLPENAFADAPPNDPERGLHFICVNANISRQFEFLQNAWMNSSKFSGLTGESDPLLGNRQPIPGCPVTSDFTKPEDGGVRRLVSDVPQFVTVRGGAYFFLPSLRTLRFFAGAGNAQECSPLV
jgi:Dyp-type peroxidase family